MFLSCDTLKQPIVTIGFLQSRTFGESTHRQWPRRGPHSVFTCNGLCARTLCQDALHRRGKRQGLILFSCHSLSIGFLHTRHVRWDRHTATARDTTRGTTRGRSRRKSGHVAVRGRKEGTRGPASAPGLHRHRRCTCVTRLAYETTCSEGKCACACLACGARSTCVQTRSTPTGSNAASVECRSRACERLGTRRTYETNAWVEWNHSSEMVRASKTCCE